MNHFRTICIIYEKEYSYYAGYLKNFFEWIGLPCFDYCYSDGSKDNYLLMHPKSNCYDIVVTINYGDEPWQVELRDAVGCRMYSLNTDDGDILSICLENILNDLLGKKCVDNMGSYELFNRLEQIYKTDLIAIMDSYIFKVLSTSDDVTQQNLYQKLKSVLAQLELPINPSGMEIKGYEYYFYAKMNIKRKIDELDIEFPRILEYDVEDCLKQTNDIYKYDNRFFQADYLKSKFSRMDSMYKLITESYVKVCVEYCPVYSCRAFYNYDMGKYYEIGKEWMAARNQFELALQNNPFHYLSMFSLALRYLDIEYMNKARNLLTQLLKELDFRENYLNMSPMEWELVYISNMLLGDSKENATSFPYYDNAAYVLQLLEKLKVGDLKQHEESYFYKLCGGKLGIVCDVMKKRFGSKKLYRKGIMESE